MIGALSMAISSVVGNEATGFPPSEFPYTVAFLAPLTAGYILVFSTIIAFVVVPTVILFTGLISIWPLDRRDRRQVDFISVQSFLRLFAVIFLFYLLLGCCDTQDRPYDKFLYSCAVCFAFSFENYHNLPSFRTNILYDKAKI